MVNWKRTLLSAAGAQETYWVAVLQNAGLTSNDEDQQVSVDSAGNVYFIEPWAAGYGDSTTGQTLTKFDAEGTFQWSRRLRASTLESFGYGVQFDSSNNPIILALQGNGTSVSAYKLNASDGSTNTVKSMGSGRNMETYVTNYKFTAVQSDGTLVYAASGLITDGINVTVLRVNPSTLEHVSVRNVVLPRPFGQRSTMRKVAVGPNDEIVLFGSIRYDSPPNLRAYALVLDSTGSSEDWAGVAQYSSSSNVFQGFTGDIDSSGNCYVAGNAYSGNGTAVVKFPDNGGSISWGLNWDQTTTGAPLLYHDVKTDGTDLFMHGYTTDDSLGASVPSIMSISASNGSQNWTRQVVYNSKPGIFTGNLALHGDAVHAAGFINDGSPKKRIIAKLPKDGSITGTFGLFQIKSRAMTTAGDNPVYFGSSSGATYEAQSYTTSSASMITNSAITWTIDDEILQ